MASRTALVTRPAIVATVLVALVWALVPWVGAPSAAADDKAPASLGVTSEINVGNSGRPVDTLPAATGLPGGAWQGFGINWNGVPYDASNGTPSSKLRRLGNPALWHVLRWRDDPQQLQVDEQRLTALHPAFVRMSWSFNWFAPTYRPGDYQWNSPAMQDRYRDLEFLQAQGIPVVTGMFRPLPGTVAYGSTKWLTLEADLVSHLVKTLGFTNIKLWIGENEPNTTGCAKNACEISYDTWLRATNDLRSTFEKDGLLEYVLLAGPTVSSPFPWTSWTSNRDGVRNWASALANDPGAHALGTVDWHQYLLPLGPDNKLTGDAALETVLRTPVEQATARIVKDIHAGPYGAGMATLVSEFGFQGIDGSRRDGVPTYTFSLAMLNYGMDIARAGVGGAAVWQLDTDLLGLAIAGSGLWSPRPPYRPYYLYGAMTMLFHALPTGSVIEPVSESGTSGLNVLAARTPTGGAGWSVLIINNTSTTHWIQLGGLTGARQLSQYDFSGSHQSVPSAGSSADFSLTARRGSVTTEVAPESATLLAG